MAPVVVLAGDNKYKPIFYLNHFACIAEYESLFVFMSRQRNRLHFIRRCGVMH
jgi:hypothetical protein